MLRTYRIYHYRPDQQPRDVDTLIAKQLYSAKIATLNDPFEFAALKLLADYPEKQQEFKNVGVTCFCRSISNPLLWSHYAAGHKGFAIGYDAAHPFFGGDKGLYERVLMDIRYEDSLPTLERFSVDELALLAAITKPTCWAYEQELRIINRIGGERFNVPADTIKEIIFGVGMSPSRVNEIVQLIKGAKIDADFAQMELISDGFGVRPRWLH
jgi:Protein of unknown function (DUF2971)